MDKSFWLKLLRIYVGNKWSRTGATLAIMGAMSLLGWLDQLVEYLIGFKIVQPPTWVAFAVMLVGVGLLVWGYSKSEPEYRKLPHDIELWAKFRELVPNNLIDFLRHHNFGTPWQGARLDPVAEIAEMWIGAQFEFHDPELDAALCEIKASANQFEELIAYGSWVGRSNPEVRIVKTDEDYRIGTQPGTIRKIQKMNESAAALVGNIDALERLAQVKLS